MSLVREPVPLRQYVLATTPGGTVHRWGADEADPANVIEELQDSDTVPGGYKELTGALARKPGVDYADMQRGTKLEVFGAGHVKVGEYRLERAPRTAGDKLIMDPAAVGYQAHLTDDESAQAIPIDADMSEWGEPSSGRKLASPEALINQNGQVALLPAGDPAGGNRPAISHSFAQMNTTAAKPDLCESWWDGNGVEVGNVIVGEFDSVKGIGGEHWDTTLGAADDAAGTGFEALKEFGGVTTGEGTYAATAEKPFLYLQTGFFATFTGEGNWEGQYRGVVVFDRSGIPVYGTWPEVGVLASDVIAYALSKWAPLLKFTAGAYGSIKPSSFLIPHLSFKEPTTVMEMVSQALKYELLEWGVWNDQTFYLNNRGEREGRKRWRARVRPAQLEENGRQMDRSWNGAVVQYQDVDGSTRIIGPPGSGFAVTSERLLDTDPQNPANQIPGLRRWIKIVLNGTSTEVGAVEAGERFLEQFKLLDGSGSATLTGYVEDEHGALWPYWMVHAGDLIEFLDASIPGYRYIVSATRSRATRSVQIELDAPPDAEQALLERMDAQRVPLGIS